jgi:hypothetical protein
MAHYAKLDENNIVIDVIVIANKDCLDENGVECEEPGRCMCEALTGYAKWKKTSRNTKLGVYCDPHTGEPSEDQSKAYRLNFAQLGFKYDKVLDGFIVTENLIPKRHSNMEINPKTGYWALPKPSVPYPEDLELDTYSLDEYLEPWFWDNNIQQWIKVRLDDPPSIHRFTKEEVM